MEVLGTNEPETQTVPSPITVSMVMVIAALLAPIVVQTNITNTGSTPHS